jgi:CRISPR-associated endonuclease/helicase Cas3
MLVAAAGFHDAGKARRNWQVYAGNPGFGRDPANSPPLAKFDRGGDPARLRIGEATYRQEFGTLRDAGLARERLMPELQEAAVRLQTLPEEQHELALHLIAAHHGHARPAIPAVDEAVPSSNALAREAALRFARLQRRWGPWGLAWWEALLRATDWAASRQLNETAIGEAPTQNGQPHERESAGAEAVADG